MADIKDKLGFGIGMLLRLVIGFISLCGLVLSLVFPMHIMFYRDKIYTWEKISKWIIILAVVILIAFYTVHTLLCFKFVYTVNQYRDPKKGTESKIMYAITGLICAICIFFVVGLIQCLIRLIALPLEDVPPAAWYEQDEQSGWIKHKKKDIRYYTILRISFGLAFLSSLVWSWKWSSVEKYIKSKVHVTKNDSSSSSSIVPDSEVIETEQVNPVVYTQQQPVFISPVGDMGGSITEEV